MRKDSDKFHHLRRFLVRIVICLCFSIVDFDMNGTTVGAGGGGVGVVPSAWQIKA